MLIATTIISNVIWFLIGIITGWCSIGWLKDRYMRKQKFCALCEEEENAKR